MYFGKHTQTEENTLPFMDTSAVVESVEALGWEDSEWVLMEAYRFRNIYTAFRAEFPCHYYGDYTCELTANRPDSMCPFHAGEED